MFGWCSLFEQQLSNLGGVETLLLLLLHVVRFYNTILPFHYHSLGILGAGGAKWESVVGLILCVCAVYMMNMNYWRF